MDTSYHIDVTPEEDLLFRDKLVEENENKKPFFANTFWIVAGVHLLIIVSLIGTAVAFEQNKKEQPLDFNTPIPEVPISKPQEDLSTQSHAVEQVIPPPTLLPVKPQKTSSKYTELYIVKPGDTVYSISKKYRLNVQRLLEINKIKDPNKIFVGQELFFLKK